VLGVIFETKKNIESQKYAFQYTEMTKILKDNYDISNDDLHILCDMMIEKEMIEYIPNEKKKDKKYLRLVIEFFFFWVIKLIQGTQSRLFFPKRMHINCISNGIVLKIIF
jgi:hypothetical protein